MILRQSRSTYPQLFPHLIRGKRGSCLLAITPRPKPGVGRRSLKTVREGPEELILVEFSGFNPQLELSVELRPSSGVPIVLQLLGKLAKSQRGRVQKRFQPNAGCNGRHLCGIISHTNSGEGLGEQKLGWDVGISSNRGSTRGSSFGILCLFPGLLRPTLRTRDFNPFFEITAADPCISGLRVHLRGNGKNLCGFL